MSHTNAHEKCDSCTRESAHRRRKRECAGTAFGRILLRQPQCVHSKIRTADAEKKETEQEPSECTRRVEQITESDADEHEHQHEENGECAAPSESLRQPRSRQAAEDRTAREQPAAN